jgi:hypothetical protein
MNEQTIRKVTKWLDDLAAIERRVYREFLHAAGLIARWNNEAKGIKPCTQQ